MKTFVTLTALFVLAIVPASASILFSDTFDASPVGLNVTPTGWTSSGGTVDTIANGGFGITCLGNVGNCVDLDGSTGSAGVLSPNVTFNLTAGTTYILTYNLSGNQRGGASDTVDVSFGGLTNTHTLAPSDPFAQHSISLTPLSNVSGVTITFHNLGGDNVGAILDSVQVSSSTTSTTPEPSTFLLLAGGVGIVALRRRKA